VPLAQWTLQTEAAYRSELVQRQTRLVLLDTIACAFAGARSPTAQLVLDMVDELGGKPQCSLIGTGRRTSVLNAVLANGVSVRCLDLNDVIFIQKEGRLSVGGHPSDNIPVAVAVGERAGASLGDVLNAIVVGYELFGRLRDVMPFSSVWDGTSASGLVAATMAGRLTGLNEEKQANALALAAIRCATPKVVRWGHLSSAKNLANAMIARAGVEGALLAEKGLTGPPEVLDHPGGMRSVFDPSLHLEKLWAPAPKHPQIMFSNVKTFPCIGTAQSLVGAALDAHKKLDAPLDQIESMHVVMADLPMVRNQQAEENRRVPTTREDADHSFTYLPVAALRDGELTDRQFENERWLDDTSRSLTAKVRLSVSAELADRAPGSMPARLTITFRNGRKLETECLYPPGHSFPDRGLDQAVVAEKFREVTHASLPRAKADAVISFLVSENPSTPLVQLFDLLG
jgi:2-methylcitrate dehydratase